MTEGHQKMGDMFTSTSVMQNGNHSGSKSLVLCAQGYNVHQNIDPT